MGYLTRRGGASLLFSCGDERPPTALPLPCILKSSWSCQCWKNGVREQLSGSVCNFGKSRGWGELLNILFFFKKKKYIYIYSFLFYFALVTSVSPSSCSHKLLSVNTSLGHDKSWHSGAKLSETMWQKEKIKKKSRLRVNEAGRPNMWNVYIHPNWEADALVLGWTREWAKSFCFGEFTIESKYVAKGTQGKKIFYELWVPLLSLKLYPLTVS